MTFNFYGQNRSTVPELRSRYSKLDRYTKLRYTNRPDQVQRPFLLAGEIASPAGRVLRVSSTGTGMFFRPGTNLVSKYFRHDGF